MFEAIGNTYGLWTVTAISPYKKKDGRLLYECICNKCGNVSYLSLSNIKRSRGRNCKNCLPDYHFQINNDIAIGTLPNGANFMIDSEDIERVSQYRWYFSKDSGYIVSTGVEETQTFLHRFVLKLKHTDSVIVDHINRQKTDCRKENLRIVTVAQNTLNKTLRKSSKTGYMGVGFDKTSGMYTAKIQIGHKGLLLGKSATPEECAQMYNIASKLLFGEFGGHKNNVSDPPKEMIEQIELLCQPVVPLAKILTQPVCNTRKD